MLPWGFLALAYLMLGMTCLRRHARAMGEGSPYWTTRFWRIFATLLIMFGWPMFLDTDLYHVGRPKKQDWSPRGHRFYVTRWKDLPW